MIEITYALIAILIVISFIWRWQRTSIFINTGIPGPKPNLLFGNLVDLFIKGPIKCHEEWVEKYGNVFGYYYGMKPILLVADPDLLKNIYIRDFSKFVNRETFNPLSNNLRHDPIDQSIINLRDKKWKDVRSVLTPTFTTAKMKQMSVAMNSCMEDMISVFKDFATSAETFNIHDIYQKLTVDVIAKTAFGVNLEVQKKKKSDVLRSVKIMFRMPYRSIFVFLGLSFPLLRRLMVRCQFLLLDLLNHGMSPVKLLRNGIREVIVQRRGNEQYRKTDLLQLMMDTKIKTTPTIVDVRKLEAGDPDVELEEKSTKEDLQSSTKNMSDEEIIASAFIVLLAGYETTSTALAFTTYLLAKHPNIQEKAYEEIRHLVTKGEKLDYGTVNKLPYLEKVLNESMRVFPPVFLFTNRFASEDVTYGSLTIPKDMMIQAPTHLLHHNPDYWSDPDTFDPERFDTKPNTNGITYFPFGIGPRNCLGMRFAQMEAKLALAHTIYNFQIHLSKEHEKHFPIAIRVRTLTPRDGVKVKLTVRKGQQ